MKVCSVQDCGKPHYGLGLCRLHHGRYRRGSSLEDHERHQQSLGRGGLAKLGLHKHHPFYMAWVNMKTRCNNPKSTQYQWYGARGIQYNEAWEAFAQFYLDMWEDYSDGFSLERIDNNGHYSKLNCKWIPLHEQALNRRARNAS